MRVPPKLGTWLHCPRKKLKGVDFELDMVMYTYNLITQEVEVERSQVQGSPGLHIKILSQKKREGRKEEC